MDLSSLEAFGTWLVDVVHHFGYIGIFIMTFIESTFVPIPGEVTMIPAGYLVRQGEMNFVMVVAVSTVGSLSGALANYFLAYNFGRKFFYKYGKYFFFNHDKIDKLDKFFSAHGHISTFTGRLIPGLRHFISFPAGLARMNLKKFCFYTALGSFIWMTILTTVGYLIGGNKELLHKYMPYITGIAILGTIFGLAFYIWHKRKNRRGEKSENL